MCIIKENEDKNLKPKPHNTNKLKQYSCQNLNLNMNFENLLTPVLPFSMIVKFLRLLYFLFAIIVLMLQLVTL